MPGTPLAQWQKYLEYWGGRDLTYAQDPKYDAMRALNIRTMHSTVIVGRQGEIVFRDPNTTTFDDLKEAVEKAL